MPHNTYVFSEEGRLLTWNENKKRFQAQIAEISIVKKQLQDYYRKIEQLNQVEIELKDKIF